jgi:MFS family permease
MFKLATALLVFLAGFAVMVLEVIGARYLAKDFGGSFYVWISQIGVILVALALGYAVGGTLADHYQRASLLAIPLCAAGLIIWYIPNFTPLLVDIIIMRHPLGQDIPNVWQKLDPALGSGAVFFLPCLLLAILPPYMIRIASQRLEHVGKVSGLIYSASTVGSIAGVFASGYFLIDYFSLQNIFQSIGILVLCLAGLSLLMESWLPRT